MLNKIIKIVYVHMLVITLLMSSSIFVFAAADENGNMPAPSTPTRTGDLRQIDENLGGYRDTTEEDKKLIRGDQSGDGFLNKVDEVTNKIRGGAVVLIGLASVWTALIFMSEPVNPNARKSAKVSLAGIITGILVLIYAFDLGRLISSFAGTNTGELANTLKRGQNVVSTSYTNPYPGSKSELESTLRNMEPGANAWSPEQLSEAARQGANPLQSNTQLPTVTPTEQGQYRGDAASAEAQARNSQSNNTVYNRSQMYGR